MISRYTERSKSVYFDANEILASMLCEKNNWITTGNYQISSEKMVSNECYQSSSMDFMMDHIVRTNTLYQMYSHVKDKGPLCGLNQRVVVSNDGAMVSCICQENQNCAVSMHNTTFIDVSVALVLILSILILCMLGFKMVYHVSMLEIFKENSNNPTVLVRLVGLY
jgi:hypothetical protein